MFLSRTTRGDDRLKPFRVLRCDLNMDTGAHASLSHARSPVGIPKLESSVSINPLAVEYGDPGICAFNVQPGPVKTERLLQDMSGFGFDADAWAPPEVIGEVVLWLATRPEADKLNGQCIQGQEFCVEHDLVPGWKPAHNIG